MTMTARQPTLAFSFALLAAFAAGRQGEAQIRLGFDELPGMVFVTGSSVPPASKLSNQYLASHGVAFRSRDVPYVAVANIDGGFEQSASPPNAIGAVTGDNRLEYAFPMYVEFFLPAEPTRRAVTSFVAVRADRSGSEAVIVLTAYDLAGNRIGRVTANDTNGPRLQLSQPGIHRLEIQGAPGTAFDDFTFEPPAEGMALGDCNRNGVADDIDLTSGTSIDADQNGRPDECEGPPPTPLTIGFDDVPGMPFNTGTPVPTASAIGDRYLASHGVVFRSAGAPYVAVTAIGGDAASPPNAIGGVSSENRIEYTVPFTAEFFLPGDPTTPAVTDFVSIRADFNGVGAAITLTAFDLEGSEIDSAVLPDWNRATLSIAAPGIHSVEVRGAAGTAFDDFQLLPVTRGGPPFTDCNRNGIEDAEDIASGASADRNQNGKPDECDPAPSVPTVELIQSGARCLSLFLTTPAGIRGGEIGLAHDPALLSPLGVKPGKDLPPGSQIHFQPSPANGCAAGADVAAGIIVGWVNATGAETPPGRHEILKVCYVWTEPPLAGACSSLRFVDCLGAAVAPVRNIVTAGDGASLPVMTADGQLCQRDELPFRRGDVNGDGNFDISDPIGILGCLFLGSACSPCADATDANDDGLVNIGDPVYLLTWRFLTGSAPPVPFPDCGADDTVDAIDDCEASGSCP